MKIKTLLSLDYLLLFSAALITVFGVLFIYSSGVTLRDAVVSGEYIKQIIWASSGFVLAVVLAFINYRRLYYIAGYLYAATALLLIYTCLFGREVSGAKAWIGIGGFGVQPSEFAKITTILFLAFYLAYSTHLSDIRRFITSIAIVLLPVGIILLQPDLGTALVFIPVLLVMTFIAGIELRYIFFTLILIALCGVMVILPFWQEYVLKNSVPFLAALRDMRIIGAFFSVMTLIFILSLFGFLRFKKTHFYWIAYFTLIVILAVLTASAAQKVLKPYQIMRLVVFINPNIDPQGSGWNIIQSITAIGSGGALGKGFLQGTQSHYRFIPQQSTDFIFSIFSEEWGFLGGALLFVLFLIIILRLVKIMKSTQDPFGSYIAAGLAAMYIFHFIINVGMTMGMMPITGIPLLFMSYGGSSLIAAMAGVGLALSVYVRRFQF